MRLLNVYNLSFGKFEDDEIPPYAIASHRWRDKEVTYLDVLERKNSDYDGFKKIESFCAFTKRRNRLVQSHARSKGANPRIEWIWIDTCCIDRRSSEEIRENITLMFRYYERAEECYAYLFDLSDGYPSSMLAWRQMRRSQWFSRGWTLQELLAPARVFFIAANWDMFGHKCAHSAARSATNNLHECPPGPCAWGNWVLNRLLAEVTYIGPAIINGTQRITYIPPEEICKWIQQRQTKKEEDLAYCLLGLLGISLIPHYGEGQRAWSRLEEEVSKKQQRHCSLPAPLHSTAAIEQEKKKGVGRMIIQRRYDYLQRIEQESQERELRDQETLARYRPQEQAKTGREQAGPKRDVSDDSQWDQIWKQAQQSQSPHQQPSQRYTSPQDHSSQDDCYDGVDLNTPTSRNGAGCQKGDTGIVADDGRNDQFASLENDGKSIPGRLQQNDVDEKTRDEGRMLRQELRRTPTSIPLSDKRKRFSPGDEVWLTLSNAKYPMVIKNAGVLPARHEPWYQLTSPNGRTYTCRNPGVADNWVPGYLVSDRPGGGGGGSGKGPGEAFDSFSTTPRAQLPLPESKLDTADAKLDVSRARLDVPETKLDIHQAKLDYLNLNEQAVQRNRWELKPLPAPLHKLSLSEDSSTDVTNSKPSVRQWTAADPLTGNRWVWTWGHHMEQIPLHLNHSSAIHLNTSAQSSWEMAIIQQCRRLDVDGSKPTEEV